MKKLSILTSFMYILLAYACNDTTFDEYNKTNVEENIPASVVLDFSALENQIQTRAVSDEATEKEVNNLYVFIFNNNGAKSTGKYFDKSQLTGTQLKIDTYSGSGKQIYAVANFAINDMMSLSLADLENVNTKDELMALSANLKQRIVARGSSFLMSGTIEKDGQPANIDIQPGTNPSSLGIIKLRRVDAKVQFNIKAVNGAEFTLKEWRVKELPLNVALFNQAENRFDGSDNFSIDWKKPEGEGANLGKTFSFYVLEHLRGPKTKIESEDPWTAYALREKNPFNWAREGNILPSGVTASDDFVFANDRATYVEFKGHIKYMKGSEPVEGDVTYTVHLGYFDSVDGNRANDYNVRRNTFYTYNVEIASADRVLVEVETGVETHPGADGNLAVGGKTLRFDAHYETTMVEFHKDKIDDKLTWYVNTPFDKGFASEEPKDYDWILFRINSKTNNDVYDTNFKSFSGMSNLYTGSLDAASFLKSKDKLINIKQLVAILKSASKSDQDFYDRNGNVRFTAFIQEYYYDKTPGSNGAFEPVLWKRFVNAPERVLNILSENKSSPDNYSMRTKVFYSIRQASIQTMYNTDVAQTGLIRAWGTEMIQDPESYPFEQQTYNSSVGASNSNGRSNTIALWNVGTAARWDKYVAVATNKLNDKFRDIRYTCMSKNRDLNGNQTIDRTEIRWYLAAINQLTDLWIGEKSFDADARLYNEEIQIPGSEFGRKWGEMWYASSTILSNNRKEDPLVLWSSEGSSIGPASGIPMTNKRMFYRCVRNLGIEESSDEEPQDFASYNSADKVITLDYLNKNSIRDFYTEAELPLHHEREPENLPYQSFKVAVKSSTNKSSWDGATMSWFDVRDDANNLKSPCLKYSSDKGWRVPNQRELALMQSRVGDDGGWDAKNHMSRTRFSKDYLDSKRCGFSALRDKPFLGSYKYYLYLINNSNEVGGVRCVKDEKMKR